MSTLSLPALRRDLPAKHTLGQSLRDLFTASLADLNRGIDRRCLIDTEQRMAAAIAANGGLLTDDLERRLMPGGRSSLRSGR